MFYNFIYADDLHHWVCTTSVITHNKSDVLVMDSLGKTCQISHSLEQQIAQVYGGGRSQLTVHSLSVQQQVGVKDCGLFAVAFAVELCQKHDPSQVSYDQRKMRAHFISCLQKEHLVTFPRGQRLQEKIPRPKGQTFTILVRNQRQKKKLAAKAKKPL